MGARRIAVFRRLINWILGPSIHDLRIRNGHFGRGLPLAILENRETDATIAQVCVIDPDTLLNRSWVKRVGEMTRLRALHRVHPFRRFEIAAAVLTRLAG